MTATVSRIHRRPSGPVPPTPDCGLCRLPQAGTDVVLGPAAGVQYRNHTTYMMVTEVLSALVEHHAYLRGTVNGHTVTEYVDLHGIILRASGGAR